MSDWPTTPAFMLKTWGWEQAWEGNFGHSLAGPLLPMVSVRGRPGWARLLYLLEYTRARMGAGQLS